MLKRLVGFCVVLVLTFGLCLPAFAEKALVGDIDGDWVVSSSDARKILEYARSGEELPAYIKAVADIDGDGKITENDARLALKYAIDGTERLVEVEPPDEETSEVEYMCLTVGEICDLNAFGDFSASAWRSTDTSVAAVENGKIVAKALGSCEISASNGKKTHTVRLRVSPAVSDEAPLLVIDVSSHQGKVDFNAVRDSGITAVLIRLGIGNFAKYPSQKDSRFDENVKAACEAGLDVGVYVYSYAENTEEAAAEANATIDALKDLGGMLTYPVYFDYEEFVLGKALGTEVVRTYCEMLRSAGWYSACYASASVFFYNLDKAALRDYDFWVAAYGPDDGGIYDGAISRFLGKDEYAMWQYTSKGSVPGITTGVDLNFCYKSFPKTIINGGYNGFRPEGLPQTVVPVVAPSASGSAQAGAKVYSDAVIPDELKYSQSGEK